MSTEWWAADGDLLIGGEAIAGYINTLVDPASRVTASIVYGWVERGHLPVKRIGNRIVASKAAIRRALIPA
jgi:hypothetical protein